MPPECPGSASPKPPSTPPDPHRTPALESYDPRTLDTSILVAAFRSRFGASNEVVQLALQGRFEIVASTALFLEYESVLQREDQRSAHGFTLGQIDIFLTALAQRIQPVDISFQWRPQLRDEGDEFILEAAINGEAQAIVTHNVKDFLPVASSFRIRVITPAAFLKEVRS